MMTMVGCRMRGRIVRVSVTGHAQYAKLGEPDIVCAAVSALACTLLRRFCDLRAEGAIESLDYRQEAGDVWLRARVRKGARRRVRAAVDTVLTGLAMLAEAYPGHVGISEKESLLPQENQ